MGLSVRVSRPSARLDDRNRLLERFGTVRAQSVALAAPLSPEDQQVQSMPDVSPTKWHLAHITWFFETFLLKSHASGYQPLDERYGYLFNSYYEGIGPRQPRPQRGLITRPSVADILEYRAHVDRAMDHLIRGSGNDLFETVKRLVDLGLHHEQQHQELLLMDIKHVLSMNPLQPTYKDGAAYDALQIQPGKRLIAFEGGLVEIGDAGGRFAFDNEGPRHKVWLEPFKLANGLVTAGDWAAFIESGGYRRPDLWLSDGWAWVQANEIEAPLYWRRETEGWSVFTLNGRRAVTAFEPVVHVSFYEADAYARWAGGRLPHEAEWEVAAALQSGDKPTEMFRLHPAPLGAAEGLRQMFGAVWQWTASPYTPYPGFKAAEGAIGEYNGKFMSGQMVLRGSACITPEGHARHTYRNFFPPAARWAFGGVRLAYDV